MPNPVLYILPEDHSNQVDIQRREFIAALASWGALNMLSENVYYTDKSAVSQNRYGIEDEYSHKRASIFLHYGEACLQLLRKNLLNDSQLAKARDAAMKEIDSPANAGAMPKNSTERKEIERFILTFPVIKNYNTSEERRIEEKYKFYNRNLAMAGNIKNIVTTVLAQPNAPHVFVLSVGVGHVDSSNPKANLSFRDSYSGTKDLPTILGRTIAAGSKTVDVESRDIPLKTIAEKALELGDDLPFMATARLKAFLW
jgi:hypothetical protein